MKKYLYIAITVFTFILSLDLSSQESLLDFYENSLKLEFTKIICESTQSKQDVAVRPIGSKATRETRNSDKVILRIAWNENYLLKKFGGHKDWTILWTKIGGEERNRHEESVGKDRVVEATLVFNEDTIKYGVVANYSDTDMFGPFKLHTTKFENEWSVDRTTGYFSYFAQETSHLTENNKYKGDGFTMITAQGNCEKETGNKF